MCTGKRGLWSSLCSLIISLFLMTPLAFAGEADIKIPDLTQISFMGGSLGGLTILNIGLVICAIGMVFGWLQYNQTKNLPAHPAMLDVSNTIWETCKTYLFQQGKFLAGLWLLIAICMVYYFVGLQGNTIAAVAMILFCSVMGILGSYGVAWFGIRINTVANSRAAFASLSGNPLSMVNICLRSGMSVGLLLVSIELFFMILILAYIPEDLAGPCFIGFAIGESLGASALRICGGIFTKIADIGSDLMKIIFHLPEDDPKNPGVIADCTGDNAGDSVGPTADGFETYGVTGVALISFILLAVGGVALGMTDAITDSLKVDLLVWIFVMRILMIATSIVAFWINGFISKAKYGGKDDLDFEAPLTNLVWITSILSIAVTFIASYIMIPVLNGNTDMWWILSIIISCGTIGGALIPEFTKIFTSPKSSHVQEVVAAGREGGASLVILSGLVAGNFSAIWTGLVFFVLMFLAYFTSTFGLDTIMIYPSIFAFGLVAFGLLGMGPVTIAVDSYGPVTDNAQSVYELSQIEGIKGIKDDIKKNFGFDADFENAKYLLEKGDGAGNTFKATAKPVLIGTAVVGATTMVFSIIVMLTNGLTESLDKLSILNPEVILGLLMGGCVVYWFTGASTQAVVTGAYRAVVYIKEHIKLDSTTASIKDSKEVVKICTIYAQKGMINIFVTIFCLAL